MATSTHALSTTPRLSVGEQHGLTGALKSWWEAYWRRRAQRVTVFMLQSLDDRCLHDIGLDRSEIASVVYGKLGERQQRYDRNWR